MEKIKIFFLLTLVLLAFSACDKVDQPYSNIGNGGGNGTNKPDSVIRKILLEDLTGHTCGNCPEAAKIAMQLQGIYGKKLIVVGVHANWFARPQTNSKGSFSTDFRTPAGEAYYTYFGVTSNPIGFVNRIKNSSSETIISHTAWGTTVEAIKDLLPELKMSINFTYEESSRALNTTVTSEALTKLDGQYNLVLYLVEDNIVDWQKDYSMPAGETDVPNFLHRHVLRDNINSTWGDEIITTSLAKGDSIVKKYNNYLLNPAWKAEDCSIIAYIYNKNTEEIIQAEEVYLKK
ncbi:MAG: Omp28 family outer membrane lipoprotein [Bacteroidetes bacterium]|nr:Omp28 family outer membrane lipoprotein [Bacteroidota bacterium]